MKVQQWQNDWGTEQFWEQASIIPAPFSFGCATLGRLLTSLSLHSLIFKGVKDILSQKLGAPQRVATYVFRKLEQVV